MINSSTGLLQNVLISKKATRKLLKIPETVSSKDLPSLTDLGVHLSNKAINLVSFMGKSDKKQGSFVLKYFKKLRRKEN